jgi:UDP-N-acetylmuramoyl-L-alanyl-D-glutamate--2,6-diaminopimelate ligase
MGRMADFYFGHPSRTMTIIGVTGTNGKTTTTYILESIISASAGVPAVAGTVNYRLGGQVLKKAVNTTPLSLELLGLLANFRDGGATHAALEVSSHALALKRIEEVEFDAAIFTNLGLDHLDFHKTAEEYFRAKAHLFELLSRASSSKKRRLAILNADDPRAKSLRHACRSCEILTYGLKASADITVQSPRKSLAGTDFEILFQGRAFKAQIQLIGEHNLSNALAAAAAALGLGLPEEGILQGLKALGLVPGRLEPVHAGQDFHVFIDYAHTESALRAVLKYLKEIPHRKLFTVFGCGGERDRQKRGPMGLAACSLSDLALITSDNPRGEDPLSILRDIEAPLKTIGLKNYKIIPNRGEAIASAIALARSGDVVLIAGKGHEDIQILKNRTIPFDDRKLARSAIRQCIST